MVKANLLSLQIQFLRQEVGSSLSFWSDLASRGLEQATGDKRKSRSEFKKVESKSYGKRKAAASHQGLTRYHRNVWSSADSSNGAQTYKWRNSRFPSSHTINLCWNTGRIYPLWHLVTSICCIFYKMNDLQLHLNDNYIFSRNTRQVRIYSEDNSKCAWTR